ncbi:MAG TPA: RidA family protein [Gemmatimonadota bacterium]|jgi:2-iminobutanoate/2-iminopropanoate deaminase|nr:RidA family protein [Gemmatimonadota bacterium]
MHHREAIRTDAAPPALGPYSQAIVTGNLVFTAGQLGGDPRSGQLPEGIEAQTLQALRNIASVLEAAGAGWKDVVKTTVFLADMSDFAAFNAVYAEVLEEPFPARSTVEAAALPKGARIEIDAVAVRPDR